MSAENPLPPFLPEDLEAFKAHASEHPEAWFKYFGQAYEYIQNLPTALTDSKETISQYQHEIEALKQEAAQKKHQHEVLVQSKNAIIEYQREENGNLHSQITKLEIEKENAIRTKLPTVTTPTPVSIPISAEPVLAPGMGTDSIATPPASEATHRSERLPDPEKFEGKRADLRRFVSQIHEKMAVNRDRYPSARSRMAYVTNRLTGIAYAQILPYVKKGICQLQDYEDILKILEGAFGDPNRINNARSELFRLRQTNKEFGTFFAEFQRLALEGEMSEDALPTLLEQAISKELRQMLMHSPSPNQEYTLFAEHLQNLENRMRHYNHDSRPPAMKSYTSAAKGQDNRPMTPPQPGNPVNRDSRNAYPDTMDLSRQQRSPGRTGANRKERGECYRCGSSSHLVRHCPHPDTRPTQIRNQRSPSPRNRSPAQALENAVLSRTIPVMAPQPRSANLGYLPNGDRSPPPSSNQSENGVSLM
jgi:hypothetical protein